MEMRKWLIILMTLLATNAQAQRQQISFIEETNIKNQISKTTCEYYINVLKNTQKN